MSRVLRIINRLNLGGPTFNAAYLSKYLAPEHETLLVSGMKDESEASSEFIAQDMGLEPIYIKDMYRSVNPLRDRSAYRQIKKIIQDFKPDIVHTHAAKAGALGRLAASECGVPVILHTFHGHVFHSYFNKLQTNFYRKVEQYLAAKSTKIIAISRKQKLELSQIYNICSPDKIATIPLGFDLSRFRENIEEKRAAFRKKYQIADDEIAVGIIGRLVPIKNHSLFLQSLQQVLQKTDKKVRAFIVGDGEMRDTLQQQAEVLGVDFATPEVKKVAPLTFTSWIKEIDEVNAGLDIVALTSLNEGTPVSLIEAQAANNPIVSTDVGGVCDVVLAGKTALLSESKDLGGFTNNLLRLIEDADLRDELSSYGNRFVEQRYSYKRLVADMAELYDQLVPGGKPVYHLQPNGQQLSAEFAPLTAGVVR